MLTIEKIFRFEAAHRLPNHDGKCRRLHGHSWVMRVRVRTEHNRLHESGSKAGMLLDYGDLKRIVQPLLDDYLDHRYLNVTLKLENPTSEHVAMWVADWLRPRMPQGIYLHEVVIEETCTSACTYHCRA